MARDLRGAVVVVTGAGSGIGRAAAERFAREGAHVVVSGRGDEAIEEAARACTAAGPEALAVQADVTSEAAVEGLALQAVQRFGRIDVWVNNAGVYAAGRLEETPTEVFEQLLRTNFLGVVHGTRAALARFRQQRSGTLVNVSSVDGVMAAPYFSAYVASKHAVRGFSHAVRQELRLDGLAGEVKVVVVMPATIDTPLFQHAADYSGMRLKAMDPVYPVEKAAAVIVRAVKFPRREVMVGSSAVLFKALWTFAPALAEPLTARMILRSHFERDRPASGQSGNVFGHEEPSGASGGWLRPAALWARRGGAVAVGLGALAAGAVALRRKFA